MFNIRYATNKIIPPIQNGIITLIKEEVVPDINNSLMKEINKIFKET
jgi:hypothetical protein